MEMKMRERYIRVKIRLNTKYTDTPERRDTEKVKPVKFAIIRTTVGPNSRVYTLGEKSVLIATRRTRNHNLRQTYTAV